MLLSCYHNGLIEAGLDEAGRGCLAGPVYAAAVIFPPGYENAELNDSKQLTARQRQRLREVVKRDAVAWAVASCSPQEIDRLNILRASILAMHRAVDALTVRPQALIVDGNRFTPYYPSDGASTVEQGTQAGGTTETASTVEQGTQTEGSPRVPGVSREDKPLPYTTIVKGDGKYLSIAAASILAKTFRDERMEQLDQQYPGYQWERNKGYPTLAHREAIRRLGPTPEHRRTFTLLPEPELPFAP